MTFALAAGPLFQIDAPGEFEETIISKCVDQYIATSAARHGGAAAAKTPKLPALSTSFSAGAIDGSGLVSPTTPFSHTTLPSKSLLSRVSTDNTMLDPTTPLHQQPGAKDRSGSVAPLPDDETETRLTRIVERLFDACLAKGQYRQVIGIAVEARNLDMLRRVIVRARADDGDKAEELTDYLLGICMDVVQERSLRTEILGLILSLLNEIPDPDYFAIARCAVYLDVDKQVTAMLRKLVDSGDRNQIAHAYQIAFDLYDNGTQEFLGKVIRALPEPEAEGADKKKQEQEPGSAEQQPLLEGSDSSGSDETVKAYNNIRTILVGTKTVQLNLEFLYRNNRTDLSILNRVRDSLESRNSIFHTAVTLCNAFMNQGTTHDKFFRDNLEWLGKAVNWSKFTATAALGVIHRGNLATSRKLLEPYLPKPSPAGLSTGSPYSQGGALYAYGLIHANHGADALEYLKAQFSDAEEEIIVHGGALGLGLAGMASGDEQILQSLRMTMFTDSALNGEAVGLSMGLIMLGTGNVEALDDMFKYARDTKHEKTVRGLSVGMALIMYGRQEGADELIDGMLADPDPTLRYGGILTVALAYCGTGSNKAIRRLLHVAVSDVSDDVRRVAVMSLGFILFRKPGSVPRMVELLAESYNPHVRYGSAMALGISCAGTGLVEAIDLLEPMMKDPTDFVRQGALIALSMIMIQQNEVMNPKVATIRKTLKKVVGDRHEDAMTKFGAAIALGIIDAGGRNCTIGLQTPTGNLNTPGIVGMAVFLQYWYWFPLTHFLSLAFTPTAVIGLDADLEIPEFRVHCATRPSLFDYPPEQEVKADEGPTLVTTAILSTTAQAKRRAQRKERAARRESMDVDVPAVKGGGAVAAAAATTAAATPGSAGDKMDVDEDAKDVVAAKEAKDSKDAKDHQDAKEGSVAPKEATPAPADKKKAEKVGYEIENMTRVLPGQLKYISFPAGRYQPVKKPTGGPILLLDSQPDEPKTLIEAKLKKVDIEKAPVVAAPVGGVGAGADLRNNALFNALRSGGRIPASASAALANEFGHDVLGAAASARGGGGGVGEGGAAGGAAVAQVPGDEEDLDEAPAPFEYFSNSDEEGDEDEEDDEEDDEDDEEL
jgi:26S proteasome regulatory subunit N2